MGEVTGVLISWSCACRIQTAIRISETDESYKNCSIFRVQPFLDVNVQHIAGRRRSKFEIRFGELGEIEEFYSSLPPFPAGRPDRRSPEPEAEVKVKAKAKVEVEAETESEGDEKLSFSTSTSSHHHPSRSSSSNPSPPHRSSSHHRLPPPHQTLQDSFRSPEGPHLLPRLPDPRDVFLSCRLLDLPSTTGSRMRAPQSEVLLGPEYTPATQQPIRVLTIT